MLPDICTLPQYLHSMFNVSFCSIKYYSASDQKEDGAEHCNFFLRTSGSSHLWISVDDDQMAQPQTTEQLEYPGEGGSLQHTHFTSVTDTMTQEHFLWSTTSWFLHWQAGKQEATHTQARTKVFTKSGQSAIRWDTVFCIHWNPMTTNQLTIYLWHELLLALSMQQHQ